MGLHGRRNPTNLVTRRQVRRAAASPIFFAFHLVLLPFYLLEPLLERVVHAYLARRRRRNAPPRRLTPSETGPSLRALSELIHS